ncbi:hypothetical protein CEXT_370841 [Caerostris extrusa]|uniref:Uncharacterized protein n=1 Tax=Caerostris extrusa TaxID=172846 RepID=A0AAV4XI92_CAEEX|nr:hypothetical protein CEXT_370841 [Caerostris extrusa]
MTASGVSSFYRVTFHYHEGFHLVLQKQINVPISHTNGGIQGASSRDLLLHHKKYRALKGKTATVELCASVNSLFYCRWDLFNYRL